jgi:CRISPR-associated protein Csx10
MRLYYTLTTIDPLIMSQTNATTNNHECLDYIPGSAILGVLAERHYQTLSKEQSWQAFHNGQCRFSPCYPVCGDKANYQIALPTPASWFIEKGVETAIDGICNSALITNYAAAAFQADQDSPAQQCKDGYLTANNQMATVRQSITGKTAIDPSTGSAAESQLFSYAYIEAGQTFAGWIDCENQDLLDIFKTSLNQTIRVGRSRNTEFGRAKLKFVETPVAEPEVINLPNELVIWCISDCEVLNAQAMPTLNPAGEDIHLGLKTARLNRSRSFVQSFRCSRFNQKRQGPDSEQVLIKKGSVLVFDLKEPASNELLNTLATQGIGLNRQQGLGWVHINPLWAAKSQLLATQLFLPILLPQQTVPKTANNWPDSLLITWVKAQVEGQNHKEQRQVAVNQMLRQIVGFYHSARRYNNILNRQDAGPSSSQWQRINEQVRSDLSAWQKAAFEGEQAICKANNDDFGWGINWHNGDQLLDFASATQTLLQSETVDTMRLLLEQLCRYDLSTTHGLKNLQREYKLTEGGQ